MGRGSICWLVLWAATVLLATAWAPQGHAPQAVRARGAKVTFERVGAADAPPQVHSQRARLLSLAVERGEAPAPFLPPGLFRATYRTILTLPARDRFRFRAEGRGKVELSLGGEKVLDGALRPGKHLETAQPVRLKKGDNELLLVFESAALGDGQFRLFWAGDDFGFEPIAPEKLTFAADDPDVVAGEQIRAGMQLFVDRRCARCHEPQEKRIGESAFAELDAAGPDLRTVGARTNAAWLAAWLREPRKIRPDATMPEFALTEGECNDLAVYLAGLGGAGAPVTFAADAADKGRARFRELGCIACHVAPEEGAADAAIGDRIALVFAREKWRPEALVEYLQEPRRHHPHVRMPDLRLSRDDALPLAAYVLAGAAPPPAAVTGDAAQGKRLAHKHGCALCHGLDVQLEDRQWPRLRTLHADRGCLADKPAGAPDHGLSVEQRAALRAFLPFAEAAPFRRSPLDFAARHLYAERCTACHGLDGEPSVWARVAERAGASAPLPKEQDPLAQGVPALTWTGSKLQPSWIERFVTGQEKSPRPWLTARMPSFVQHGGAIAQGLVREHGYGQEDEPPVAPDATHAMHGERLIAQGTGFFCVQCHALGDKPAAQVFEREGIELLTARGRLRHEYFTRWLADPPRLDPDAKMPRYADNKGKTAFKEVLGGDAAAQFEAIWQYLGGLRASRR